MSKQWFWMMDYCKRKGLPPVQSWAWEEAKTIYKKHVQEGKTCEKKSH